MKILKIPLILLAIAATLFAAAPVTPPSGELIIWVNPSTNLNANFLRITGGKWILDDKLTNCIQVIGWEAWRTNGGNRITDRGEIRATMAEMKALHNAANPRTAIKNAVLADAAMTEKP